MGLIDNLKNKVNVDFDKIKKFIDECCEEDKRRAMQRENK